MPVSASQQHEMIFSTRQLSRAAAFFIHHLSSKRFKSLFRVIIQGNHGGVVVAGMG